MTFLAVFGIAMLVVLAIALRTNRMVPEWDMQCYLDMAANGVIGNRHLVSPFAYSLAVPLIVREIAHLLNLDAALVFHACAWLACIAFVVSCFYFARSAGAALASAVLTGVTLALNFNIVKWALFSGTMLDIYVYPLILLAFWLILRKRFFACLALSGIGLFFKEFMLLPLLTQAAVLMVQTRRKFPLRQWLKNIATPLLVTFLVLVCCFVLPRVLIHVERAVSDYAGVAPIDPFRNPASLRRLYSFPANLRRDFNIVFAYFSWWLPALLLLDARRVRLVWDRLRPYRLVCALYLGFHFLLVMYGGTNLDIFATYSVPVLVMALVVLLDEGAVQLWEKILMVLLVVVFNRLWMYIPLPQQDLWTYLNFYGGFNDLVTRRSLFRMAELLTYVAGFALLRELIFSRSRSPVAGAVAHDLH
jgi:hypothetical protein